MTLDEQIKIVKREIDFRKRCYPVWVEKGKMTQAEANYQIEGMEYVLNSIVELQKFKLSIIAKNDRNIK